MQRLLHIFIVAIILLAALPSLGGKKKANVRSKMNAAVFLKDDSVARGYLMSALFTTDSVVRLNYLNKLFARDRKYPVADIDSIYTWYDDMPQVVLKWMPVRVVMSYAGTAQPTVYDRPCMATVACEGRNLCGYVVSDAILGTRCAYKTASMPYAVCILPLSGKVSERRRRSLSLEFKNYPDIVEFIRNMDDNFLKGDPFKIFPILDRGMESVKR